MSRRFPLVVAVPLIVGLAVGLGLWGSYETTSTLIFSNSFCLSCHEMDYAGAEYRQTVHFSSRTGVRARCADCHVPRPIVPRLVHMVMASRDVLGHVIGTSTARSAATSRS